MRLSVSLLVLLCAQPSLFAQPTDVIRGCVTQGPQGVILEPLNRNQQAFDTSNLVNDGRRFLLFGDDDLLDELADRDGNEIEVTGHINPAPPDPILEPPILNPPGGGGIPGVGSPLNPRVSNRGTSRTPESRPSNRGLAEDVLVVTKYKMVRPGCSRPDGF